ncbi:hypothetical protein N9W79_02270 [bacterium]|nr:hypothetical protein [bacterium]
MKKIIASLLVAVSGAALSSSAQDKIYPDYSDISKFENYSKDSEIKIRTFDDFNEKMIEGYTGNSSGDVPFKVYVTSSYYIHNLDPRYKNIDWEKREFMMHAVDSRLMLGFSKGGGFGQETNTYCYKKIENEFLGYEINFHSHQCPANRSIRNVDPSELTPIHLGAVKVLLKKVTAIDKDEYKFLLSKRDSDRLSFRKFEGNGININCADSFKVNNNGRCQVKVISPPKFVPKHRYDEQTRYRGVKLLMESVPVYNAGVQFLFDSRHRASHRDPNRRFRIYDVEDEFRY